MEKIKARLKRRRKTNSGNKSTLQPKLRLAALVMAIMFGSIVLAQLLIFARILYDQEERLLGEMSKNVSVLVRAATVRNTLDDITEKDTIDKLNRLVAVAPIMGGRLYDTLGDPAGSFGVEPELSRSAVAVQRMTALRSNDGLYYDIFLSQGEVGLPFDIILRLDTSNIQQRVEAYLAKRAKSSLISSIVSVAILLALMALFLIKPIIRLRKAVRAAIAHPDQSDRYRLNWTRKDEIGELGRVIDRLLLKISSVYQNDLAAAQDTIQQSKSSIVQYDSAGRLVAANPAALIQFGAVSVEEMARQDSRYLILPNRPGDQRYSVLSAIEEVIDTPSAGSFMDEGLILLNGVEVPTLIIARPVHKQNGEIMRYFANLVDISERTWKQNEMASKLTKIVIEKGQMNQRIETMKMVLESCVILLEAAGIKPTDEDERKSVMADRVVTQWYRDAQNSGLIDSSELEYGVLPVLRGNPEHLSRVFRQALTLTFMKSYYEKPSLTITTATISESRMEFTIRDKSHDDGLPRRTEDFTAMNEWKICLAAFQKMLAIEGGEITNMQEGDIDNHVSFALHTLPESSHITSSGEKVIAA